ncbi:DUF72 domain-containing protein [candidate division KSB1 bacterium]|nr:DUF72 domain-containing protein [candidate division KSB1 bacterium]
MSLTEADYKKYVRWGTSTWTFEGWKNQIYFKTYKNKKEFNHASLAEYCAYPLFGIIGMDLWYYRAPSEKDLEEYAPYIPADFPLGINVFSDMTVFRWPQLSAYGAKAGCLNTNFLNAGLFINEFLPPFEKVFKTQPLIFIFELMNVLQNDLPGEVHEFSGILDGFLAKLPPNHRYAVEVRNKKFIDPIYFNVLNKYGVAHCYNQWAYQHSIGTQLKTGGLTKNFVVVRALQPAGWGHSQSENFFKPFDRLKLIQPDIREDILQLIRQVLENQVYAYIIINNRLEGNAPGTIQELDEMVHKYILKNSP